MSRAREFTSVDTVGSKEVQTVVCVISIVYMGCLFQLDRFLLFWVL